MPVPTDPKLPVRSSQEMEQQSAIYSGTHVMNLEQSLSEPSTSASHDPVPMSPSHLSLDTLDEEEDSGSDRSEDIRTMAATEAKYTTQDKDKDYETLLKLAKARDLKALNQLRKKIRKIEGIIARQNMEELRERKHGVKLEDMRPTLWADLVERKNDDLDTILMLMLSQKHYRPTKNRKGRPKKIKQKQSIQTLNALFKGLSKRSRTCLIMEKDPDHGMSIINELAEHRRWDLVEYLLKKLEKDEQRAAVLHRKCNSCYPDSLYVIASEKEPTLFNILTSMKILPEANKHNTSRPINPPHHPSPCTKTGFYGTALVVNIAFREEDATQRVRTSSDSDHAKLCQALTNLHYNVTSLSETVTKQNLFGCIENLEIFGSVFLLAVQTHGAYKTLALSDSTIKVDDLIGKINDLVPDNTKKVALLQHCRTEAGEDNISSKCGVPHDWLIGYSSSYGQVSYRNSYLLQVAETLSDKIGNGRYLTDVIFEVHANIKAKFPCVVPQLVTSFTSDVYLTPSASKESLRLQRKDSLRQRRLLICPTPMEQVIPENQGHQNHQSPVEDERQKRVTEENGRPSNTESISVIQPPKPKPRYNLFKLLFGRSRDT